MDGREMERLAQRNKNWVQTGFAADKWAEPDPDPVVRAEAIPESVKRAEPVAEASPATSSREAWRGGITAIKIDGRLHSIREPSDSDTPADKLNLELLGFMFGAYGRNGLLPISDLVEFVKRNNLMAYLEVKQMTPVNQEQFDKRISDLLVRGLSLEETRQEMQKLHVLCPEFAIRSKLVSFWIEMNERELIRLMY